MTEFSRSHLIVEALPSTLGSFPVRDRDPQEGIPTGGGVRQYTSPSLGEITDPPRTKYG